MAREYGVGNTESIVEVNERVNEVDVWVKENDDERDVARERKYNSD